MSYVPYLGGTLLIPSATKPHLFIILTNACSDGNHLLVNVTSIQPKKFHDDTCVFHGGEHEQITHQSYIYYRMIYQAKAATLTKCVGLGHYAEKPKLDPKHFESVCGGILKSKFTPPWAKTYFSENKEK